MSLRLHLLNLSLKYREKPFLARVEDPAVIRARFERTARLMFWPPRGAEFSLGEAGGVPVQWAAAPGADISRATLLYFHGGGYVFGSPRTHRAMLARLSALTGMRACLPRYRLAPEHAFPAAIDDALAVYHAIEGPVIIGGDSAGGGIALALLSEICAQGLKQPVATFLFSPLTDMTFSGQSFEANAEAEVLLPAHRASFMSEMYLAGADPKDPRASPLWADFSGAGPIWVTVGSREILLDDTMRLVARLRAQGVDVHESVEDNHPHVWPLFQRILPEADRTLKKLAVWLRARTLS